MGRCLLFLVCFGLIGFRIQAETLADGINVGTYSIVARDAQTGDLGVAVQSKFFAVGAVVPFAKAGVGAMATQAYANTTYGSKGLSMLESGMAPEQVVKELVRTDPVGIKRQVGLINAEGVSAAHTGSACFDWAGHITGTNFCVQGNILADDTVLPAMTNAFLTTQGELGDRLVAALVAAEKAGGDRRGRQSAALLVVRDKGGYGAYSDRWVDIRVDDHLTPVKELSRLLNIHKKFYPR